MYKSNYNFEVAMKQKQGRKLMGVWDKKKNKKAILQMPKGQKNAPAQLNQIYYIFCN